MTARHRQSLSIALACLVGCAAFAAPAAAQFRDFFGTPWRSAPSAPSYSPFYPQPQVYEPTRPPPPHKVETPPSETIIVVGDQLAEWLAYGLEEVFADTPEVGVVRKIKFNAGLVRYEARADAPEWPQAIADILAAEKPSAIVVMLGINDRLPLRDHVPEKDKDKDKDKDKKAKAAASQSQAVAPAVPASSEAAQPDTEQASAAVAAPETQRRSPNGYYEFHGDKWAELYAKRIDAMIAALKAKGAPVLWVGLPAVRGTKSTADMSYLDDLYRARAEKAGITYVDVWDGFVDERGLFTIQGPDFEGQIRRLRTGDGVNFTKYGAEKLARYVEHDLRRVLTNHVVPVALPGPEEQPKGVARPAIGPVVPLSTLGSAESGDLLGANSHPAQRETDPIATRVLSNGEPIPAPAGRADDFSWPRADANANSAPDTTPLPNASPGPTAPPKGAPGKSEMKKSEKTPPIKPRVQPNNGAPPRPPLPVGSGPSNERSRF
jgi:hypothetical protein